MKQSTPYVIAVGVPEQDAPICANVLIESDKHGIDSHGVGRLKLIYTDRIKEGIQFPVTNFEIIRETCTTAVVDGHDGMGMVAVRNSTHYGIAGYYACGTFLLLITPSIQN